MSNGCPTSWQWSFDPPIVTFINGTTANSQNPEVSFIEQVNYSVTLVVTNDAGSNTLVKEDYISIGGLDIPFMDDFELGSLNAKSWTVVNPDFGISWDIADVAGGIGNKAAYMNFFDYVVPPGQRDQLISPVLNFSDFDEVYFSFKYAYAKQHLSVTDSLIVKISGDCGETWTRIFEGGEDNSGNFATHELMDDVFIPEVAEDWCGAGFGAECSLIDLSAWAGSGNVKIMFETYNYFGNNLYIDDVMVGPLTNLIESSPTGKIKITPNPSTGKFKIVMPENTMGNSIQIYNAQGESVQELNIPAESNLFEIDLRSNGKGIYFIKNCG